MEDIINKKFGRLTVIKELEKDKHFNRIFLCKCECGKEVKVQRSQLISGKTKSCGCLRKETTSKNHSQNLIGKKFNKLTVIKEISRDKGKGIKWLCLCECGNTTERYTKELNAGAIKSCGCLSKKHGQFGTRLYQTWADMKRRCTIPTNKSYKYYGALGVKVCPEWITFEPFFKWAIENGYNDTLTIDRINPYGNYEPSNCRWATAKEQAMNKRKNYKKE